MSIELHELVASLRPETFIVVSRGKKELLRGTVADINDLHGFHHNLVIDIRRTLGNVVIDIE